MYLCNCNGLSERAIREALAPCAQGMRPASVAALFDGFGCRPRCGKCVEEMRQLIDRARDVVPVAIAAE